MYRHSLGRPRDLAAFGGIFRRFNKTAYSNELNRQKEIKEKIHDAARVKIIENIFEEFKPLLTCLSGDSLGRFLSLLKNNILTTDEVQEICEQFNNRKCAKKCEDICTNNAKHPFCDLINMGLLGIIKDSESANASKIQKFTRNKHLNVMTGDTTYYLMHPALRDCIKETPRRSCSYTTYSGIRVGSDLPWTNKDTALCTAYKLISKIEYTPLRDFFNGLVPPPINTESQFTTEEFNLLINDPGCSEKDRTVSHKLKLHLFNTNLVSQTQRQDEEVNPPEHGPVLKQKMSVFVSYAWDNPEHERDVENLVTILRQMEFDAHMDSDLMIDHPDLDDMMTVGLNMDKVIIVLSEGYKKKAETMQDGVGAEFKMITKDLEAHTRKYIFVSFEQITHDLIRKITPIRIGRRWIVDLYKDKTNNYKKLKDFITGRKVYPILNALTHDAVLMEQKPQETAPVHIDKDKAISSGKQNDKPIDTSTFNAVNNKLISAKPDRETSVNNSFTEDIQKYVLKLKNGRKISNIRQMEGGKSASQTFKVYVDSYDSHLTGWYVVKLSDDSVGVKHSGEEAQNCQTIKDQADKSFKEHIVNSQLHRLDRTQIILSDFAADMFVNSKLLCDIKLKQKIQYVKSISYDLLVKWNSTITFDSDISSFFSTILGTRIKGNDNRFDLLIRKMLVGSSKKYMTFDESHHNYPNPHYYINNMSELVEILNAKVPIQFFRGKTHGDFHARNIMCNAQDSSELDYRIFDTSHYNPQSFLLYDHALLEIDNYYRILKNEKYTTWKPQIREIFSYQKEYKDIYTDITDLDCKEEMRYFRNALCQGISNWVNDKQLQKLRETIKLQFACARVAAGIKYFCSPLAENYEQGKLLLFYTAVCMEDLLKIADYHGNDPRSITYLRRSDEFGEWPSYSTKK